MALALLKKTQPRLTFLCRKEDEGVIPAPYAPKQPCPTGFANCRP